MSTVEGSFKTGWLILFTADETKKIAKPVSDYGSPIAAATTLIPEPAVTKIISIGTSLLIAAANKAVERGKSLGVYVTINPLRFVRQSAQTTFSDTLRELYFDNPSGLAPFFYDEKDPRSVTRWRKAARMLEQTPCSLANYA